jgi:hypothetical protein
MESSALVGPGTHKRRNVTEKVRLLKGGKMTLMRDGDVDISTDVTVTGRVSGSIVVHPGGCLVLMGEAGGGVIVRGGGFARIPGRTRGLFVGAGGHAVLTGNCQGSVTNDGGELSVDGVVTGEVAEHAGTTTIGPNAVIHHHREMA